MVSIIIDSELEAECSDIPCETVENVPKQSTLLDSYELTDRDWRPFGFDIG